MLLAAAALIGLGSSIFHPESSRIARMASGGRHGFAQSLFQVGGNVGSAIGPLLAALIILPYGQKSVGWFSVIGVFGMILLFMVGRWYATHGRARVASAARLPQAAAHLSTAADCRRHLRCSSLLMFSKFVYTASLSNYFTFYLIETFGGERPHGAALPLRLSWRPLRPVPFSVARSATCFGRKDRHLVLDPWRTAVHAASALCQPVLDAWCSPR